MNLMNLMLDAASEGDVVNTAYEAFIKVVNIVLPIIISVLLVFGIIYSIILGVNYSKAEDSEKREEAKKRLVGAIIGVVVAGVLVAIIWVVLNSGVVKNFFGNNAINPEQQVSSVVSGLLRK